MVDDLGFRSCGQDTFSGIVKFVREEGELSGLDPHWSPKKENSAG